MPTPSPEPDDESLLRAVAAHDEAAFARLYDRFSPGIFRMILQIVRARDGAEEVLQEAFWQVWERAKDYRPEKGSAFAWIVSVARHKAIDHARRNARHVKRLQRALKVRPDEDFYAPVGLDALAAGESQVSVEAALSVLTLDERRAIALAFFEGLTHGEIAALLSTPVGTVKARIRRGLLKLKPALAKLRPPYHG